MMYDSPVGVSDMEKEHKKKHEAMLKRIKGLGVDNPVVKGVTEEDNQNKQEMHKYEDWEPVRMLQREAFEQYEKGDLTFDKSLLALASALFKLAGKSTKLAK